MNFTIVQSSTATGVMGATFTAPVTAGNLIVAIFGGNYNTLPVSVTDNNSPSSDIFTLFCQGYPDSYSNNGIWAAIAAGGATNVSFSGAPATSGTPSVIIFEVHCSLSNYLIFGVGGDPSVTGYGIDQQGLEVDGSFGLSGGTTRTGGIEIITNTVIGGFTPNNCAIALQCPNADVLLIKTCYGYVTSAYYPYNPINPPYTSDGTVIAETVENTTFWGLVAAYKDYPYLMGPGCSGGVPPFSLSCGNPPNGSVGVFYTHTFPATGVDPLTFAIIAGGLPAGLTLASSTGIVSGTPTTPGASWFTIQMTDADSNVATVTCAIGICQGGGNMAFLSRC